MNAPNVEGQLWKTATTAPAAGPRWMEVLAMRLIDADKIQWKSYPNDYGETNDDYVEKCDIDNMPTVDAVPVLRCKDCKDWGPGT